MENFNNNKLSEEELEKLFEPMADLIMTGIKSSKILKEAQKENRENLKDNYPQTGKIISCHILIERLINRELKLAGKQLKQTFAQKVQMLPAKGFVYSYFIPGIMELNKIRNKLAHNLNVIVAESQLPEISKLVSVFERNGKKFNTVEDRIEQFTVMCVAAFGTRNPAVMEPWNNFLKVNPGFEDLLKTAGEALHNTDFTEDND
jgi:hypothetical protein